VTVAPGTLDRVPGATMSTMSLSPADVRALLARHDIRPSRALGQNFLVDPNTARRIVRLAGVEPGDRVLEIGPGIGSLTVELARQGAHVVALELDRHLLPVLDEVLHDVDDVHVVSGNAMTADFGELLDGDGWRAVSNLPYNIATPLVMRILSDAPMIETMLVMVQREVGERLAAGVGDDAYGAVSVKVAYYASARVVGVVPPTVFAPRPNVESALVRIVRHPEPPVSVPSEPALFSLVQSGFAQRRKMLRGAMRTTLGGDASEVLRAAGVDPRARAESLDLEDWARLARTVQDRA
jgi:16S rRNA (adenine1518-N6/adenine1519-N6)-dimethyltransferase